MSGADIASSTRRAAMLRRARDFFEQRKVLEVDTPILSRFAVSDPQIESIEVGLALDSKSSWYLQTSPEYCMKRLLSAGYPDIYEICKVFRDGESGRHHQPEFTMVEWYRRNFTLKEIMQDTVDFISCVLDKEHLKEPPVFISYAQAFSEFAAIDYSTSNAGTLADLLEADDDLRTSLGDRREEWLNLVFAEKVSSQFPPDRLTVLHHYPASQAALARICPDDASVADRFEVFAGPLELANGYVELLDANEQMKRFEVDQSKRELSGRPRRAIDDEFVAALKSGLPPCAGVAVGFDRLHMLNEGIEDIRQTLNFPIESRDSHD
jgi:lysyl-tRNA synthetase class 2